ncbi:MAG TPA: hypothetical protein VHS06_03145 [Chloroflexota bacterium]|nr:hypothetical protein [Chloroflexota bacterium]HEX2987148.1 hypothetical protein [Chloroflexota bacterium]
MSEGANAAFGRIPSETQKLLQAVVQLVRDEIPSALPPNTGEAIKARTVEVVLRAVLKDWYQNYNVDGLREKDIDDLKSFVALAADLAGKDLNRTSQPIYEALLEALLEDWLINWNDGTDGPPERE